MKIPTPPFWLMILIGILGVILVFIPKESQTSRDFCETQGWKTSIDSFHKCFKVENLTVYYKKYTRNPDAYDLNNPYVWVGDMK